MAIGVGLMFNIILPVNFNSPYQAVNIIEFWKRWHMSLSRFITTYLHAPIMSMFETITIAKSMFGIFLAMFIAGLWHGAGWTFILWGALHGAALVVNHIWKRRRLPMPRIAGWLLTFGFVNFSLVLFRGKSLADAWKVLKGMIGLNGILSATQSHFVFSDLGHGRFWRSLLANVNGTDMTLWTLLIIMLLTLTLRNSVEREHSFKPSWRSLAFILVIGGYAIVSMNRVSEFLYFQF
jgi:hypothetical protein